MTSLVITELRHSFGFVVSEQEPGRLSRDQVTLIQQTYTTPPLMSQAGTVLGVTGPSTGAPAYAANGGNTGNFTCGAVVESAGAVVGVYSIEFIAATVYNVYSPSGDLIGEGKTGVAFAGGGLGFTLMAGGTAAVAGDGATITVAANANAGLYDPVNLAATDGTQNAVAILGNTLDASGGNTKVTIISRDAEVNGSELIYPAGASAAQIAALNAQLAQSGIIVR